MTWTVGSSTMILEFLSSCVCFSCTSRLRFARLMAFSVATVPLTESSSQVPVSFRRSRQTTGPPESLLFLKVCAPSCPELGSQLEQASRLVSRVTVRALSSHVSDSCTVTAHRRPGVLTSAPHLHPTAAQARAGGLWDSCPCPPKVRGTNVCALFS